MISGIVALVVSSVSGCFSSPAPTKPEAGAPHASAAGIADRTTADEDKIVNFAQNKTSDFRASHGYKNRDPFDCTWSSDNAEITGGVMNMSVTQADGGYYGAEYRSGKSYSYGYYSVCMRAAACSGVISSFFTYTNYPKWDEIDIEFLGNDTTKVQFNYYTSGTGGHEYVHELGFDASEGMHEYGFDWQSDYIVWYVDGKAIYKAIINIPFASQRIMLNVWNGKGEAFENWCGKLDKNGLPATAQYAWIAYKGKTPTGDNPGGNTGDNTGSKPGDNTSDNTGDNTGNKPGDNTGDNTGDKPGDNTGTQIAPDYLTAESDKIANFAFGESNIFHKANNWTNGNMFDCYWYNENIAFDGGNMTLSITDDKHRGYGYAAGEYRTNADYGFGYISASIKAAKCDGVVTSLFTYTNNPRWDEIDIEILGKDTTKVQFNYYTNGVGGHEYMHELGFDASQGFHEYAFLWTRESIIWFVDGKAVYKATRDIPQYAGKIMVNLWNGIGVDDWLKPFDSSKLPVTAQYKWIGYRAA